MEALRIFTGHTAVVEVRVFCVFCFVCRSLWQLFVKGEMIR